MNKNRSLGSRMKDYERAAGSYLPRRIPVIIRVDGKAFYTFTKGMKKPFDIVFAAAMQETMKDMCENIQRSLLGALRKGEKPHPAILGIAAQPSGHPCWVAPVPPRPRLAQLGPLYQNLGESRDEQQEPVPFPPGHRRTHAGVRPQ